MARNKPAGDKKRGDSLKPLAERSGERSSPGSGEDEDQGGTADLQPEDVEHGDTAR